MDAKLKERWVKALRSGRYKQGRRYLQTTDGYNCCLGVLCRIERVKHDDSYGVVYFKFSKFSKTDGEAMKSFPGHEWSEKRGLSRRETRLLARMNDDGKSFAEIADYIEANL